MVETGARGNLVYWSEVIIHTGLSRDKYNVSDARIGQIHRSVVGRSYLSIQEIAMSRYNSTMVLKYQTRAQINPVFAALSEMRDAKMFGVNGSGKPNVSFQALIERKMNSLLGTPVEIEENGKTITKLFDSLSIEEKENVVFKSLVDRKPSSGWNMGGRLLKGAGVLGLAIEGGMTYSEWGQAPAGEGNYVLTKRAAGAVGGGLGGWGGAAVGAGLGSFAPGPGNIIGGIVGGFVGAFGGSELFVSANDWWWGK